MIIICLFKAAPEHHDLIFTDVHMPVLDGHSAVREIRALDDQHSRSAPTSIAMTANAFRKTCGAALTPV